MTVEGVGPDLPLPKGEAAQDGERLAMIGFRSTFWTTQRCYLLDLFHLDFFGRLQISFHWLLCEAHQNSFAVKTVKSTCHLEKLEQGQSESRCLEA